MKAILITYNQAYYDEIARILTIHGVNGFTEWNEIKGRGSVNGEPHMGTHAWPTLNNAMVSVMEDGCVEGVLGDLRACDEKAPELGLRAFVWSIENMV